MEQKSKDWDRRCVDYRHIHGSDDEAFAFLIPALRLTSGLTIGDFMCGYGEVSKRILEYCSKNNILLRSLIWAISLSIFLSLSSVILNLFISITKIVGLTNFLEKAANNIFSIRGILLIFTANIIFWLWKMPSKDSILCQRKERFPTFEFLIVLLPTLLNLIILITIPFVTIRYIADVATLLIIASYIVWFYFDLQLISYPKGRKILKVIAICLAIYSIYAGYAYSITGVYGGLKETNPSEFIKIKSYFSLLSNVLQTIAPYWGQR